MNEEEVFQSKAVELDEMLTDDVMDNLTGDNQVVVPKQRWSISLPKFEPDIDNGLEDIENQKPSRQNKRKGKRNNKEEASHVFSNTPSKQPLDIISPDKKKFNDQPSPPIVRSKYRVSSNTDSLLVALKPK